LLADRYVSFLNFFLLHDLDVSPSLQFLVMNARALSRKIKIGRGVLGGRISRNSGNRTIFGFGGGAA
jgi:hypothetical protein